MYTKSASNPSQLLKMIRAQLYAKSSKLPMDAKDKWIRQQNLGPTSMRQNGNFIKNDSYWKGVPVVPKGLNKMESFLVGQMNQVPPGTFNKMGHVKMAKARWQKELLKKLTGAQSSQRSSLFDYASSLVGRPVMDTTRGVRSNMFDHSTNPYIKQHGAGIVKDLSNSLHAGAPKDTYSKLVRATRLMPELAKRGPSKTKYTQAPLPSWSSKANVPGDEYVDIAHGGTKQFLNRFLKGKTPGYHVDGGGTGIMVHPLTKGTHSSWADDATSRLKEYATRASRNNMDEPFTLRGRIQAKHLEGVANPYEAGLPASKVQFLQNARMEPVGATQGGFQRSREAVAQTEMDTWLRQLGSKLRKDPNASAMLNKYPVKMLDNVSSIK